MKVKKTYHLNDIFEWEKIKEDIFDANGLVLFKFSPICWVSSMAEREYDSWYENLPEEANLLSVKINVIGARPLSQYIENELNIRHESPQVIWLTPEHEVKWHTSHGSITSKNLNSQI